MFNYINENIQGNISLILNPQVERLQTVMTTDRDYYVPLDTIFLQVYVANTYTKQPIQLKLNNQTNLNYTISLMIYGPLGNIYNISTTQIVNSTATFIYQFPNNSLGGDYKLLVYGPKIQNNSMWDNVTGSLRAYFTDSAQLTQNPTYSYTVTFSDKRKVTKFDQLMRKEDGLGYFEISIPKNETTQTSLQISFIVRHQNYFQAFIQEVLIIQTSQFIVEFFPETGILTPNFNQKVYFAIYRDSTKSYLINIQNASLIARNTQKKSESFLMDKNLSSTYTGIGVFNINPASGFQYFLEFSIDSTDILIRREIQFLNNNGMSYDSNSEITFNILNSNKIIENNDEIKLQFQTNNNMINSDWYAIYVKQKERILYYQELQFNKSSTKSFSIMGEFLQILNGGVVSISLKKVNSTFINWYKKISDPKNTILQPPSENWLIYKGEIKILLKPAQQLKVQIQTDKSQYLPGDLVSYNISILDSNGQLFKNSDSYINLIVSDLNEIESLPSQKNDLDEIFEQAYYMSARDQNEIINQILSIQSWSSDVFSLSKLKSLIKQTGLSETQKQKYNNLVQYNLLQYSQSSTQFQSSRKYTQPAQITSSYTTQSSPQGRIVQHQTSKLSQTVSSNAYRFIPRQVTSKDSSLPLDFTQTLLFLSAKQTTQGFYSGSFYTSDLLTNFTINAYAFDQIGRIGERIPRSQGQFNKQKK
eukprot:403342001